MKSVRMPLPPMFAARLWTMPVLAALTVLALLVALKEIGRFPKPLIITLAICFLVCLPIFGIFNRRKELGVVGYTTRLLVIWAVLSATLLGALYRSDRGGRLWYLVSGYNHTVAENRQSDIRLSPAEFVAGNPHFSLESDDETRIVLPRGEYSFSRTIVVPEDTALTIEPGTTVRMRVGCSLIAYSPIIARGTKDEPIVFTAQKRWFKWA